MALRQTTLNGKFQGVITPTTPNGCRVLKQNTPFCSEATVRPPSRTPSAI